MAEGAVVVVGGTSGMGREVARHYTGLGRDVVISGRDAQRARAIATEVGGRTVGIGLELAEPETIATRLRSVGPVEHLVIAAIHPSIVGDSPYWRTKPEAVLEGFRSRTPLGRLVSMRDVVGAVAFLLENPSVTGVNLPVDGGWLLM